ncbi:unnamed protein product [Strongylus vulgaris]|uniref:Nucleoside phosphorylase domain-containing protein n=1 Tax=Strongylus vulgaris TaxID=40348 RepID=A0A3P7JB81_STRVU|nr:unnamed protein product [Strongylus vulgaris]
MHPTYNEKLRKILMSAATDLKLKYHDGGFGICINGPRYSTKAESRIFKSWGASLINMTMIPEQLVHVKNLHPKLRSIHNKQRISYEISHTSPDRRRLLCSQQLSLSCTKQGSAQLDQSAVSQKNWVSPMQLPPLSPIMTAGRMMSSRARHELFQVSMELVMKTFAENCYKAKSLFIEAVQRIAKEDWTTEIATLKKAARDAVMVGPEIVIPHLVV